MASGRTFRPISENDFFISHRAMVVMSLSEPMVSSGNVSTVAVLYLMILRGRPGYQ
jgi:hypothetical protein